MTTYDTKYERGREVSRVNQNDPKLIRLPKQGIACEWTGLGKAKRAAFGLSHVC